MAELLIRINYGLAIGSFDMDLRDGEVRFRTSLDVRDVGLSDDLNRPVVYTNLSMMDRYFTALSTVCEGKKTPVEALAPMSRLEQLLESSGGLGEEARSAAEWVTCAPLPDDEREAQLRFVIRFPRLPYFRLKKASVQGAVFGLVRGQPSWVKFGKQAGIGRGEATGESHWYQWIYPEGLFSEYERLQVAGSTLFVICATENLESALAVKASEAGDGRVYEFDSSALCGEGDGEGLVPVESARIVFSSYSDLLDHVEAVRLEDGTIFRAERSEE
jgi:hypothetical protein